MIYTVLHVWLIGVITGVIVTIIGGLIGKLICYEQDTRLINCGGRRE